MGSPKKLPYFYYFSRTIVIKNKEKAHSVTGLHLGINQNIYTELRQNTPKVDFIKKSFSVDFAF